MVNVRSVVVVLWNVEVDMALFGVAQITQNAVLHITEKQINNIIMTKAEIVTEIAAKTGFEKQVVMQVVEGMMETIKASMINGDEVFLRGFGSFIIKHRAEKTARNISKNTTMIIPAHNIPAFKPAKSFVVKLKNRLEKLLPDLEFIYVMNVLL